MLAASAACLRRRDDFDLLSLQRWNLSSVSWAASRKDPSCWSRLLTNLQPSTSPLPPRFKTEKGWAWPTGFDRLDNEAKRLITELGSSSIDSLGFRDSWLFVGAKGATKKSLFEKVNAHTNITERRDNNQAELSHTLLALSDTTHAVGWLFCSQHTKNDKRKNTYDGWPELITLTGCIPKYLGWNAAPSTQERDAGERMKLEIFGEALSAWWTSSVPVYRFCSPSAESLFWIPVKSSSVCARLLSSWKLKRDICRDLNSMPFISLNTQTKYADLTLGWAFQFLQDLIYCVFFKYDNCPYV